MWVLNIKELRLVKDQCGGGYDRYRIPGRVKHRKGNDILLKTSMPAL